MAWVDLAHIDLNLLHTFRVVVDEGGVGRAARVLGRSQPAITARLQLLEEALGVRLFQRVGRSVAPSPAGRAIEARVRRVLEGLQGIVDQARATSGKPAGLLRIGTLPTVSCYLLANAMAELLGEYPELDLELRHGLTEPQVGELVQGTLDILFSVGPIPRARGLQVVTLGSARPVVVFAAAAGEVPRGVVPLARLASSRLVLFGKVGDLFFDAVWAFLDRRGLSSRARLRVAHIQTLKALVIAGCGATILPDYTVVEPELASRPLEGLRLAQPIWMATRSGAEDIPAIAELVRRVTASARGARWRHR